MSLAASRAVLRHSTFAVRRAGVRNASSTTEAASAAKAKTAEVQSKASEGLSKVTSSAGNALSKAGGALEQVGGRTGGLIGSIQAMIPSTIYYSKVAIELGRLVGQQRKFTPPDVATFQSYLQPAINAIRQPGTLFSASPATLLNRVRNFSSAQWISAGIIGAEAIGFFTVGEMIGRMKLVGYRSSAPAHH
ncbi:hypothetical protein EJ04DRAFT_511029 [Polyplosphaeria fusca]|uniref:Mitochondrial F1F0-ATP synthase g subunit n=1 Tax=Polyplosphaeria fusca TaxID=682080 RepID=A0A9P4R3W4_9PLEO|nr:hypothetical protein EJ04DRAFT_511029 [Polyplosphaeria fusca]